MWACLLMGAGFALFCHAIGLMFKHSAAQSTANEAQSRANEAKRTADEAHRLGYEAKCRADELKRELS
jgi:hypothetical protein